MSDIGDNPFGISDDPNYSTGQGYGQFDSSALFSFFTPTSEVDVAQSWTSDAQTFSAPFADRAVDANIFLPFRQTPQISRDTTPQSIAESDFSEQSTHFVDILKVEKEESIAGSIVAPSIKDDDLEEEGFPPSQSSAAQNSLEEIEGKLARTHPLYQAQPKEDNLYHCPNEGQSGCTHKPTKLKCNYDKYVDSHLRPFRCKVKSCIGVKFSSTACLLRHEREAHGMHGHGSKPHLCTYVDCEQSLPGNGFPRRYNLFDHMKRVHDYTGVTSPPEQVPPPAQPAQPSTKDDNLEEEGFSPSQSLAAQNSLEVEEKLARTHPLYQAQPKEDDLYYCPNEGQFGCTYEPTKLKHNYDKYVDSHLRPFRCKVRSCVGVQFSSTACLLRHESEAHGMHGHGSKPHLCTYADCERSLPGNGFPRRYNLFDHMKRVHDYTGSTSPSEQVPPPVQPAQPGPKRHNSTHKRKLAPLIEDMTKKRQKATTTKAPSAATAAASTHAAVDACEAGLWRGEVSIVPGCFDWEEKRRGEAYSPDADEQARNRLAGVDADESHFEMDGHTGLAFSDVLTDELAEDVLWPDCYLRRQDAACVSGE